MEFAIMSEVFSEIPSHKRVFLKPIKLLVSMSSPASMSGQYFWGLSEFLVHGAAVLVPWHRGLRVLGTMIEYSKLVQSKSEEEHIPVLFLGALLKSYWKGEMHKEDLSSILHNCICPWCKDLDSRLYIEVVGGIGRNQIYLLPEKLVVEKPLEKLWHEKATLESLFFFLIFCLLLYSALKAGILL